MIMKNMTTYTPEVNPYGGVLNGITFFRDEEGRDWYESQKLFAEDTLKICYNDENVITQYSCDVSALVPYEGSVAEVAGFTPEQGDYLNDGTWVFDGKNIVKRTYTAQEIRERAERRRQSLIAAASNTISLWQSELLLGLISDDDKSGLIKWITYAKALKALDFSRINDEVDYNEIKWPEAPENVA